MHNESVIFINMSRKGDLAECSNFTEIVDFCATCISKFKTKVEATYYCPECGKGGRYFCDKCTSYHDIFTSHKNVRPISKENFDQNVEKERAAKDARASKAIHTTPRGTFGEVQGRRNKQTKYKADEETSGGESDSDKAYTDLNILWSNLKDEYWQLAFNAFIRETKQPVKEIMDTLIDILMACFTKCKERVSKILTDVKFQVYFPGENPTNKNFKIPKGKDQVSVPKEHDWLGNIARAYTLLVSNFKRIVCTFSQRTHRYLLNKISFRRPAPDLDSLCRRFQHSSTPICLSSVREVIVSDVRAMSKISKHFKYKSKELSKEIEKFTNKCVDFCWVACLEEPEIHLITNPRKECPKIAGEFTDLDLTIYEAKDGAAYVEWPAVVQKKKVRVQWRLYSMKQPRPEPKDVRGKQSVDYRVAGVEGNDGKLKDDPSENTLSFQPNNRACDVRFNRPHFTCDLSYNKEECHATSLEEKKAKFQSSKEQRLSKLASVRSRHNNPDKADLSDENRVTKLGENLSELYDNEWTNLFEATQQQSTKKVDIEDKSIAEGLRDVLKFCYEQCQRIANEQQCRLCSCLPLHRSVDVKSSSQGLQMRLKEFQKVIPKHSLPHIKKTIAKHASEELTKTNIIVKHSTNTKTRFSQYIDLCIDISWHTQIQDPPLKLDFDSKDSDLSNFRPYTCTGPQLDYVLWPALLLHEKGSVVTKGVAQFKAQSEIKNESTEEQRNADRDVKVADADWNNY